ncbi:hypothetical protein [Pseudoalteromonas piscicida]|uniref:hypothetical protein n=1 Tax=Pseudoalteromonas piscicida TaxID=43662 RepID=UPI003C7C18FB
MHWLICLFSTLLLLGSYASDTEASTRSNDLYQTDESGRLAIMGSECKGYSFSCNGVAVKDLSTGEFLFKENKTPGSSVFRKGRYNNFAMAPTGEYFGFYHEYYKSSEKYFYIYQTRPLKILHKIKGSSWDEKAEFSISGKYIAFERQYDKVAVFNIDTGKHLKLENYDLDPRGFYSRDNLQSLAITPDDSKLIATLYQGIAAWDLKTGKMLYKVLDSGSDEYQLCRTSIRFTMDSKKAMAACDFTTIFDVETGSIIKRLRSNEDLAPTSHGIKADFIYTTEEPFITVLAPPMRNEKLSPGIFVYNWQTKQHLAKIGEFKDDYFRLRDWAEILVHPDYTKGLFDQFREAKNNEGVTLLRELSKLYNDNNNGLTDYFPKRKKWLKNVKNYWQKQAEAQIKQAEQENKNKQLMALIVSGYLEPIDSQNKLTHRAVASYYEVIKRQKDIDALINMSIMANVPAKIKEASLHEALTLTQGERALDFYLDIADKTSFSKVKDLAFSMVYDRVNQADNIASYQWYITHVPESKHTKEALDKLYENAYELADDRGTIESYNDFIIAYPYAPQVNDAMEQAKDLEESEYSSFFTSDDELSRRLLVRSKQISRLAQQQSYDDTGYLLIVDRMNTMLQDMYPGAEATLRHLESEEFKDFHRDFNRAMRSLNSKLDDINSSVRDLKRHVSKQSKMMDQHFEKAAQDRETASELTRQHRMWERYLKGKV